MKADGHYGARRLRRGAAQFLVGKLLSAALTFLAFAFAARLLGMSGYAHYATLVAGFELAMAFCTVGMDWASARFLPEYRLRASRPLLMGFLRRVAMAQLMPQALTALAVIAASGWLSALMEIGAQRVLWIYAGVLVIEGSGRVVRDQFLSVLMAQAWAQGAAVARAATLVSLLSLGFAFPPDEPLLHVVTADLVAALVSLCVGLFGLARVQAQHEPDHLGSDAEPWHAPTWPMVRTVARHAMLNSWLVLPAGGATLTLVVRACAGSDAAAVFGIVRGLVDQVRRFLPAELFLSIVRSAVAARFALSRDIADLNRQLSLVLVLSLLALTPVLALFVGRPELVLSAAGGTSFESGGLTLACWSVSLWLFSLRRIAEVTAYTVEQSSACVPAGAVLAASPLILAGGLLSGAPLPAALGLALLADAGFSMVVRWRLRSAGVSHRLPWASLGRLVMVLALVAAVLLAVPTGGLRHGWAALALLGIAVVITAAIVPLVEPLKGELRVFLQQIAPVVRVRF